MLNPFPSLLDYHFLAFTLLRLGASCIFFYLSWFHLKHRAEVANELTPILSRGVVKIILPLYLLVELVIALGLFFGFWTQIAALLGLIICLKILIMRRGLRALGPLAHSTYALVALICLALLMTGAGAFAFDLPL